LTLSVTNKHKVNVEDFFQVFGGAIYFDTAQNGYYKWTVQSRENLIMMHEYFKHCPARSIKQIRIQKILKFYELRDLRAFNPESRYHPAWLFLERDFIKRVKI
jgi:hypothetical protein